MTENKSSKYIIFGRSEKASIVVILLLVAVNMFIQEKQIAIGVGVGGLLFLIDFITIKFIVNSILTRRYSARFSVFLFVVKLIILIGILFTLIAFAKLNIYGFIIALTALVLVIVGSSLRGINGGTF